MATDARGAVTPTVISGAGDVFVMKLYYSEIGEYEMIKHVESSKTNDRLGARSRARHPDCHPGSSAPARWGQRWSYQLTPDGPVATFVTQIYDCRRAGAERAEIDNGAIWAGDMADTGAP